MNKDNFNYITEHLKNSFIQELELQGHITTGKLSQSINMVVEKIALGWEINGEFLFYGRFVDTGRKEGVNKVPIDALIEFIRNKRIDLRGKSETSVAFAMQTSIYQKGIPTNKDENKKYFITKTLNNNESFLSEEISKIFFNDMKIDIQNLITHTQNEINK